MDFIRCFLAVDEQARADGALEDSVARSERRVRRQDPSVSPETIAMADRMVASLLMMIRRHGSVDDPCGTAKFDTGPRAMHNSLRFANVGKTLDNANLYP